ncbi:MAG: tail fiber domain-containing protein, partial [Ferruginibacter sp.]|nr:tail fiber domain-containing protein [Ferruginibacter sp.]
NGYYLLTSGDASATRSGVSIAHNGNSWVSICDKNRKENFEPLNGEAVLQKLSANNFTSWNYKMQDPKSYRHYGIMAQDFNAAFGKDKYGTIGNDTTVNPIDMIGIDMAAIQALVKRTNELKDENEKLKEKEAAINKKLTAITDLKNENESLRQSMAQLQNSFNEQQKLVAQSLQQMEALTLKQIDKEAVTIK